SKNPLDKTGSFYQIDQSSLTTPMVEISNEDSPQEEGSDGSLIKEKLETNNASPTSLPTISRIPDALSPEEMRILADQEQQNREYRRLVTEMRTDWCRSHSPVPRRPLQGNEVWHRGIDKDEDPQSHNDNLIELERELFRLDSECRQREILAGVSNNHDHGYGVGPSNGYSD
ncbi:hypothetical protein QAD02_000071, partial [Eretmocerus hayati]